MFFDLDKSLSVYICNCCLVEQITVIREEVVYSFMAIWHKKTRRYIGGHKMILFFKV